MTDLREVPELQEIFEVMSFAAKNEDVEGFREELEQMDKWIKNNPAAVSTAPAAIVPANDAGAKSETNDGKLTAVGPQIGDEIEDGTIYAGISPDTNMPMYATPKDAPATYTFNEAAEYAKDFEASGRHDFRVPSKNELNVLYQNKDKGKLKGTFNETGSYPAGWYWSSSPDVGGNAWAQCFSDGDQYDGYRDHGSSLRCVR